MDRVRRADSPDPSGYELELFPSETAAPPSPAHRRSGRVWIAVVLLAAAVLGVGYFRYVRRPRQAAQAQAAAPAATAVQEPARPLGGQAEPIALPPLDASDALVRTLVREISDRPAVAAWLTTRGLIRNFTVVVTNIAEGATPARHLDPLAPTSPFRVVEAQGTLEADPRNASRYARIADAVDSVDPEAAAKLYATLKPRIEEAHRDLGNPEPTFDRTLERAIVHLLETPTPTGAEALVPQTKGIGYAFAAPQLEDLSAAQKQLLRMGPASVRIVKAKLRAIAEALGIPSAHLPAR